MRVACGTQDACKAHVNPMQIACGFKATRYATVWEGKGITRLRTAVPWRLRWQTKSPTALVWSEGKFISLLLCPVTRQFRGRSAVLLWGHYGGTIGMHAR